jgi:hypothetical protein
VGRPPIGGLFFCTSEVDEGGKVFAFATGRLLEKGNVLVNRNLGPRTQFVSRESSDRRMRPKDETSYQKKALECLLAASRLRNPGERQRLLAIARQFLVLAAHVGARLDRGMRQRSVEEPAQRRHTAA